MGAPATEESSPYSVAGDPGNVRDSEYAVNQFGPSGYSESPIQAFAPKPTGDPDRLQTRKRVDARANLANPLAWWRRRNMDVDERHAVESVDADGFTERKSGSGRARADDPRWNPPAESRPTQQMSPHTYIFERPFDARHARTFTGEHFSMADHRRTYDIFGMAPVTKRTNTFRIEPGPSDADIMDAESIVTVDVPIAVTERGWRL